MVEMLVARGGMHGRPIAEMPSPTWDALVSGARTASPRRAGSAVASVLEGVRRAPNILVSIRLAPDVRRETSRALGLGASSTEIVPILLEAIADDADTVTATAAIHALGLVSCKRAEAALEHIIGGDLSAYAAHATWALDDRPMIPRLVSALAETVAQGRLAGMHAQRVLARWALDDPAVVLGALVTTLGVTSSAPARRYVTETIGLIPGPVARRALERIATDGYEAEQVRAEAIAAFIDRPREPLPRSIARLARTPGLVATAVATVRAGRSLQRRGPRHDDRSDGISVAQVHLAAILDRDASGAGAGDSGGVATLLSRLGPALAAQPRISRVLTIGRAPSDVSILRPDGASAERSGHRFDAVGLHVGEGATFVGAWPALLTAARGIRSALLAWGAPNVIHLRMADPGSLAAATVARELQIPTVFTMAPDPHGPIATAERRGALDRRRFAAEDARAALWYRAVLVEHLARTSQELVLFPRQDLHSQIGELMGIDLSRRPRRHTIVSEGVDIRQADRAADAVAAARPGRVIDDLRVALARLPADRRGLPMLVSVGRLAEVKGMARVVEAFVTDPGVADRANLVIVGGDLAEPSTTEAAELARITTVLDRSPGTSDGVILLGHRPNGDVSQLLAVARAGWGTDISAGGAYVCGSLKEEFGLAIVEAMAAGLPVVVPRAGGPATYVDDGLSGVIVDTTDPSAIARGMRACLVLAGRPETALHTRQVVESRFTLARMAQALTAVYRIAVAGQTLSLPVDAGLPA